MRWRKRRVRAAEEERPKQKEPKAQQEEQVPQLEQGLQAFGLFALADPRLARPANGARRAEGVMDLQRRMGNRGAQRLLAQRLSRPAAPLPARPAVWKRVETSRLVVNLPDESRVSLSSCIFLQRADAGQPNEEEPSEMVQEFTPTTVPFADSISGGIVLSLRTEAGGAPLGGTDFGRCISVVGGSTKVKKHEGFWSDTYEVEAKTDITYKWATQSCGCTDVLGPNDAAVTPDNWQDVVTDLTPGPTGRPPRSKHYCSDLTSQHELFHRDDMMQAYERYKTFENIWLAGEKVSSGREAMQKAQHARQMMLDHVHRYMGGGAESEYSPSELRAYGAGRGAYQQRVTAISQRAQREGWVETETGGGGGGGPGGAAPPERLADSK